MSTTVDDVNVNDLAGTLAVSGPPATVDLPDGRTLRYVQEGDQDSDLSDWEDCYGKTEWSTRTNDYGHHKRPDGFDGAARILHRDRSDVMWWQPPADLDADNLDSIRGALMDLINYGTSMVGIELHETTTDSRGNEHDVIVQQAWLGGLEPFTDTSYVQQILEDLIADVLTF